VVSDKEIQLLSTLEVENTNCSTKNWVAIFTEWVATIREESYVLHTMNPPQLAIALSKFVRGIQKKDGSRYKPDSLKTGINSLMRRYNESMFWRKLILIVSSLNRA